MARAVASVSRLLLVSLISSGKASPQSRSSVFSGAGFLPPKNRPTSAGDPMVDSRRECALRNPWDGPSTDMSRRLAEKELTAKKNTNNNIIVKP